MTPFYVDLYTTPGHGPERELKLYLKQQVPSILCPLCLEKLTVHLVPALFWFGTNFFNFPQTMYH